MSDEAVAAVLKRMPPLAPKASEELKLPAATIQPPKPGKVIKEPFPPPPQASAKPKPTQSAVSPFRVLRYSPEGAIDESTRELRVKFSQPMVPLSSVSEVTKTKPLELTPQPSGSWMWLDTSTLAFHPKDGRFPYATNYTAKVSADAKSYAGAVLATGGSSWKFSTPPVSLTSYEPTGDIGNLSPTFILHFNQKVSPPAVMPFISVAETKGKTRQAVLRFPGQLSLLSADEIKKLETSRSEVKRANKDTWVAFKAKSPLPKNSSFLVTVDKGCPSAEGPIKSSQTATYEFTTYEPLKLIPTTIEKLRSPIGVGDIVRVQFTNTLSEKNFSQSMVQISPPVKEFKAKVSYDSLQLTGKFALGTRYKITIAADLQDTYGQKLGHAGTESFVTSRYSPRFYAESQRDIVLTPEMPTNIRVFTVNQTKLKVQVWAGNYDYYTKFLTNQEQLKNALLKLKPTLSKDIPLAVTNQMEETKIELGEFLNRFANGAVVYVEPYPLPKEKYVPKGHYFYVQKTDIGLTPIYDAKSIRVFASSLTDGRPLKGVTLNFATQTASTTTDEKGMATLPHPKFHSDNRFGILIARDSKFGYLVGGSQDWYRPTPSIDRFITTGFTDRGLYLPGEQVHYKGWARTITAGPSGDTFSVLPTVSKVAIEVQDARGNKLSSNECILDKFGGFSGTLSIPKGANLGDASIRVSRIPNQSGAGPSGYIRFQIEEFRRPEFLVTVANKESGPHFIRTPMILETEAKYLTGGLLMSADTEWVCQTSSAIFTPAGRSDFNFGLWHGFYWCRSFSGEIHAVQTLKAKTDTFGKDSVEIDIEQIEPPQPVSIKTEVSVTDVNRQAFTETNVSLMHPSSLYVGIKCDRSFVDAKKPINFDMLVCDIDGKAVPGATVDLQLVKRGPYNSSGTEDRSQRKVVLSKSVTSQDKKVQSSFTPPESSSYLITATVKDSQGRENLTEVEIFAFGSYYSSIASGEKFEMTLTPDKESYKPGDTAFVAVSSPFEQSRGILTICREGTVSQEQFEFKGAAHTLSIPISDKHIPNLTVKVNLTGRVKYPDNVMACNTKSIDKSIDLRIPPNSRKLTVSPSPAKTELEPGEETQLSVLVKDATGMPVAGKQVSIVVADEAILSLAGYTLLDPLQIFYPAREAGVQSHDSRSLIRYVYMDQEQKSAKQQLMPQQEIIINNDNNISVPAPCAMGGGGGGGAGYGARFRYASREMQAAPELPPPPLPKSDDSEPPLKVRSNFDPLALFEANCITDAQGIASVNYKLPDNLTRYRVMALAVDEDKRFGTGESAITARLPVMAKPSPPRFLNFGDRCLIPLVVRNQTSEEREVSVVVRGNLKGLESGIGKTVKVPAGDRVELSFPAEADYAGQASLQCAIISGALSDAQDFSLPIYTPATSESFAVYGTIDENKICIAQPMKPPADSFAQFGGLEVSTSSTVMQELTDAVSYLNKYPYECTEQLSSRVIALASLKDVSAAFKIESLGLPQSFDIRVNQAIKTILTRQTDYGNFGLWKQNEKEPWPYLTAYATHALIVAKAKKYPVPQENLQRALSYLSQIESKLDKKKYSDWERRTIIAYSLYVRSLAGDKDLARAISLFNEAPLEKQPTEAIGYLLDILSGEKYASTQVAKIRTFLSNRISEKASTAAFDGLASDNAYQFFYAPQKNDAILLSAVIKDTPESDLVQKLFKSLLRSRRNGAWSNTQENAFASLAVDRYFRKYESKQPEFAANLWLGDTFVGKQDFVGRSMDTKSVNLPMSFISKAGAQEFLIDKNGPGRLYYRMGLNYAPLSLKLKPLDVGFAVERTYEAVENPQDVRKDSEGVWHVKAGALVRVKLKMKLSGRRFHVALVDPLPAGFEALNPDLKGTKSVPVNEPQEEDDVIDTDYDNPYRFWWFSPNWWDHENLRDDRSEAFASVVWAGDYDYKYIAKATTKGTFVVPPAKAEEMYEPETFGRTATETVIVE